MTRSKKEKAKISEVINEEADFLESRRKERIKEIQTDVVLKEVFSVDSIYKRAKKEKFYTIVRRQQFLQHIKEPKPIHYLLAEKLALVEFKLDELKRLYGNSYIMIGVSSDMRKFIADYEYINYLLVLEMNLLAESLSTLFEEGAVRVEFRKKR